MNLSKSLAQASLRPSRRTCFFGNSVHVFYFLFLFLFFKKNFFSNRACLSESFMHNRTADRRLQRQALVEMDRNISVKLAPATVQTLLHGADYFGNAVQSLVKPSAPSPSVPTFSVGRATLLTARLAHLELWLSSSPKETGICKKKRCFGSSD